MHPKRQWNVKHKPFWEEKWSQVKIDYKHFLLIINKWYFVNLFVLKTQKITLNAYRKSFEKWPTKKALFFVQIDPTNIRLWCHQLQHRPEKTFPLHFLNIHCRTLNSIRMSKCCRDCHSYRIPIRCTWCDPLCFEPALPFINRMHKACFRDFVEQIKQLKCTTKNKNEIKN